MSRIPNVTRRAYWPHKYNAESGLLERKHLATEVERRAKEALLARIRTHVLGWLLAVSTALSLDYLADFFEWCLRRPSRGLIGHWVLLRKAEKDWRESAAWHVRNEARCQELTSCSYLGGERNG